MCMISQMLKYTAAGALVVASGFGAWHYSCDRCNNCQTVDFQSTATATAAAAAPAKVDAPMGGKSDHTMFGGTIARNMVNLIDTDIPSAFKLDGSNRDECRPTV